MSGKMTSFSVYLTSLCFVLVSIQADRSFIVDYDAGVFLKDGKPFNYVSGSIHYSRVHPDQWYDRLYKMRFAGLDAIQVYVPWNFHEIEKGQFVFDGAHDLVAFLTMAHKLDLLVIIRPGPYICAEWEFGGFPYWLIKDNASIALRSSDPAYIGHVTDWFNVLLPKLRPLLYINGGPIISVQIENEYGSFQACDYNYTKYLLELNKKLFVDDVVYFTTDGDGTGYLKCGAINGTLTTVDFGAGNAKKGYRVLNIWNSSFNGPYVNSEYYIGWLDLWGSKHSHVSATAAAKTLDDSLRMRNSVNMYMFIGGTNFGFTSGAPGDNPFRPVPTSYDYDAALTEAGDLTYKYYSIRNTIGKYKILPTMDPPKNSTKVAFGKLNVTLQGPLHECAPLLSKLRGFPDVHVPFPIRSELMDTGYGYLLYRHILKEDAPRVKLSIPGIRDRGYVLVNNLFYGIIYRDGPTEVTVEGKAGDSLTILVDNMGRVGYGSGILRGSKGIISNVTLGSTQNVSTWDIFNFRFNMSLMQHCAKLRGTGNVKGVLKFVPSTYLGILHIDQPADTFLRLDGWYKGHVEINNFNIGRYWPVRGPQKTLFVPSSVLKAGDNIVTVTELESVPCAPHHSCQVEFVDVPEINANVSSTFTSTYYRTHHG